MLDCSLLSALYPAWVSDPRTSHLFLDHCHNDCLEWRDTNLHLTESNIQMAGIWMKRHHVTASLTGHWSYSHGTVVLQSQDSGPTVTGQWPSSHGTAAFQSWDSSPLQSWDSGSPVMGQWPSSHGTAVLQSQDRGPPVMGQQPCTHQQSTSSCLLLWLTSLCPLPLCPLSLCLFATMSVATVSVCHYICLPLHLLVQQTASPVIHFQWYVQMMLWGLAFAESWKGWTGAIEAQEHWLIPLM